MKASFQNLLTKTKDGSISGPFSQTKLAQVLIHERIIPAVSGMVQIRFSDNETNQKYEGSKRTKELTGYGTIAIITEYSNATTYYIVLDMGHQAQIIAYWNSQDEPEFIELTDWYTNQEDMKTLSHEEMVKLIQELHNFDHKPKQTGQ